MHYSAKRGLAVACRPSIRPSVCPSVRNVGDSVLCYATGGGGALNDSGVVDEGNFGDLGGYFFGNVRDKTS